jgi:hypothetical protein
MDEQKFQHVYRLRDEGKVMEAYNDFIQLAESETDALDKAGALIYAANALRLSAQYEAATKELRAARTLMEGYPLSNSAAAEKFADLELFLDFEDANLLWLTDQNRQAALDKFEAILRKHRLPVSGDPRSHDAYEAIQTRRAFLLANLGRWQEALPILEGIESPHEYEEGIAFYLGLAILLPGTTVRPRKSSVKPSNLGVSQRGSSTVLIAN